MKRIKCYIVILMLVLMSFTFLACGEESNEDIPPITEDEIAQLYTDADAFKDRPFEFAAQVFEVDKNGADLQLQVFQDVENSENLTIVKFPEANIQLNEYDFVKIKGTVDGTFYGKDTLGENIKLPLITANSVTKITGAEAFPVLKTIEVNQSVKKGDITATVTKIDFIKQGLRIYLKVKNAGNVSFGNYPDEGTVVQNGKQYEAELETAFYPEPITDLHPGVTAESIIPFRDIEQDDFTYSFYGYDDEENDNVEFSFDIKVD